jgi:hypothetical protein
MGMIHMCAALSYVWAVQNNAPINRPVICRPPAKKRFKNGPLCPNRCRTESTSKFWFLIAGFVFVTISDREIHQSTRSAFYKLNSDSMFFILYIFRTPFYKRSMAQAARCRHGYNRIPPVKNTPPCWSGYMMGWSST